MTGVLPVCAHPDVACSTCLELLTDDVVKMVKCGHMFHCTCILPWFQSRNLRRGACLNCRTELFQPEPLTAPYVPITPPVYTPRGGVGRGGPVLVPVPPRGGPSRVEVLRRTNAAASRFGNLRANADRRLAERVAGVGLPLAQPMELTEAELAWTGRMQELRESTQSDASNLYGLYRGPAAPP